MYIFYLPQTHKTLDLGEVCDPQHVWPSWWPSALDRRVFYRLLKMKPSQLDLHDTVLEGINLIWEYELVFKVYPNSILMGNREFEQSFCPIHLYFWKSFDTRLHLLIGLKVIWLFQVIPHEFFFNLMILIFDEKKISYVLKTYANTISRLKKNWFNKC